MILSLALLFFDRGTSSVIFSERHPLKELDQLVGFMLSLPMSRLTERYASMKTE